MQINPTKGRNLGRERLSKVYIVLKRSSVTQGEDKRTFFRKDNIREKESARKKKEEKRGRASIEGKPHIRVLQPYH